MAKEAEDVRDRITKFVLENLARAKGVTELSDTESLVQNGVVDSLGIFQLVAFLEDSFRVRIADEDIVHENFQSIEAIENLVLNNLRGGNRKG